MTDDVKILGGGIGGGMSMFVLQEVIHSMTMSHDINYIIRDELPTEPEVHSNNNEYFTPKKREIPSSLFEALLKRVENEL